MFSPPSKTGQFPDLWDSSKTYYLKSITSSLPVQKQMFLHIMQLAHIPFRNAPLPFIFSLRTDSHLPPSAVCYPLCFQFPSQIPSSEIISPLMAQSHATSSSHMQPLSFSVPQNPSLQSGSFLPHAHSSSPRCAATRAMTFTLFLPLINGKPELSHLISSF